MIIVDAGKFALQDSPNLFPPIKRWYRRPEILSVAFARADGIIDTLEGPVSYTTGDGIITGISGERWPVPRGEFDQLYEAMDENLPPETDGSYRRRALSVFATQMPEAFKVEIRPGQVLVGNAGDWLVQREAGGFSVVGADRFSELYQSADTSG